MAKKITFSRLVVYLTALAAVFLVVYSLFTPAIMGTADGFIHKFRAASFVKSLHEGNLRPRWLADQALGFGAPIFIYNYSVPYYAVAIINSVHSVQQSSQIYEAIVVVAAFLSMYLLAKILFGQSTALITAVAYIYAPYFLISLSIYEAWGKPPPSSFRR